MVKRSFKSEEEDEEVEEEEEKESELEEGVNENRKKIVIRVVFGQRLRTSMVSGGPSLCCQADECGVDLRMAKKYHQRHKVCERHSKAAVVLVGGIRQRFCQQCSKFHDISQFDDTKRSCRERLAGHNERRRKTHTELHYDTEQMPQSSPRNSSSLKASKHPNFGVINI